MSWSFGDERRSEGAGRVRALVVVPVLTAKGAGGSRSLASRRNEAVGLASAIAIDLIGDITVPVSAIRPATYIGKGKVDEIGERIAEDTIDLALVDCALTPVQQRNLEKAWDCKVLDRTGLILEIFGERARTKEGTLQVELAHLIYQKSRLVRSWTHLERQRGGFGFLGGPGETQIEADRRMLQDRITRIERELEQVTRTRRLHREGRKRVPYPVVALVGYTNAGKSTLFNRLSAADVLAKDMLFATLDPTMRQVKLPQGTKAILSDTVGFISDLPTMLVAAFRATLEEVMEADIVLHVRDIADPDSDAQADDVAAILRELGLDPDDSGHIIEVWNKADLLDPEQHEALARRAGRGEDHPLLVSAVTGEGLPALNAEIERRLGLASMDASVTLGADEGAMRHWLHEHAQISAAIGNEEGGVTLTLRISPEKRAMFERRFGERLHMAAMPA